MQKRALSLYETDKKAADFAALEGIFRRLASVNAFVLLSKADASTSFLINASIFHAKYLTLANGKLHRMVFPAAVEAQAVDEEAICALGQHFSSAIPAEANASHIF